MPVAPVTNIRYVSTKYPGVHCLLLSKFKVAIHQPKLLPLLRVVLEHTKPTQGGFLKYTDSHFYL